MINCEIWLSNNTDKSSLLEKFRLLNKTNERDKLRYSTSAYPNDMAVLPLVKTNVFWYNVSQDNGSIRAFHFCWLWYNYATASSEIFSRMRLWKFHSPTRKITHLAKILFVFYFRNMSVMSVSCYTKSFRCVVVREIILLRYL